MCNNDNDNTIWNKTAHNMYNIAHMYVDMYKIAYTLLNYASIWIILYINV